MPKDLAEQIQSTWRLFLPPEGAALAWFFKGDSILGGALQTCEELEGFSRRYGSMGNCYFSPNPVRPGFRTRAAAKDVVAIRAIVLDIDPVGENAQTEEAERMVVQHAEDLLGGRLYPDRIDSGRGGQLWVRLESTATTSEEEKQRWGNAVGAFLRRLDEISGVVGMCRLDSSCSDVPRLVRLPGTINTKTGRTARFISIGEEHGWVREAILDRFGVSPTPSIRPSGGDWRSSFHLLSARAKRFIAGGEAEPGRHSGAYATAKSLCDVGASYAITEGLVLKGAERCSPPLPEYEARRAVRNAFKEEQLGA